MSDILLLYLFTRLNSILGIATAILIVAGIVGLWAVIYSAAKRDMAGIWKRNRENPEYSERMAAAESARRVYRPALVAAIVAMTVLLVIPSKTDMAIIVGGKIALDASRTDTAKEVGREVLDAIRAQLREAAK